VSVSVSRTGKTSVVFVELRAMVNSQYYWWEGFWSEVTARHPCKMRSLVYKWMLLFPIFICVVDLLYRPAVMLVVKICQMAPLYQIKLLLNLVQIAIFSIHWPWCVQKNHVNIFGRFLDLGKCRVAPFLLDHPVDTRRPTLNSAHCTF